MVWHSVSYRGVKGVAGEGWVEWCGLQRASVEGCSSGAACFRGAWRSVASTRGGRVISAEDTGTRIVLPCIWLLFAESHGGVWHLSGHNGEV